MSSRSTIDMTERMTLGGAVTTSALVCGSAQMRDALVDAADIAAGAAAAAAAAPPAPGVVAATMPCSCSRSFCEIFSASA